MVGASATRSVDATKVCDGCIILVQLACNSEGKLGKAREG